MTTETKNTKPFYNAEIEGLEGELKTVQAEIEGYLKELTQ